MTKRLMIGAMLLLGSWLPAAAQDKVTLQLKWVTQAQFAGYYVAKDKGFYAVYLPTVPPPGKPLYNDDYWEPL